MNFTPRKPAPIRETPSMGVFCLYFVRIMPLLAAAVAAAGCAPKTGPDIVFRPDAARASTTGDWDDVDSAVIWGANEAEWVVHRWWSVDSDTRCYDLRNPAGLSASLRIRRLADGGEDALGLTASVGPLGDAGAEQRLIAVVERRLTQLAGVEVAEFK
jgi:hypothetical protein